MSEHPETALSAYLDGELPPLERSALADHIAGCPACRDRLAELAAVDALARELPVDAPAGYFDALPGRIRTRLPVRARTRIPGWAMLAAAAALVAVVAPLTLLERHREAPAAAPALPQAAGPADMPAAPPATSYLQKSGRANAPTGEVEQDAAAGAPPSRSRAQAPVLERMAEAPPGADEMK